MNIDRELLMKFVYGRSEEDDERRHVGRGTAKISTAESVLVNFLEMSDRRSLFDLSLFLSECYLSRLGLPPCGEFLEAIHGYVCGGIKWAVFNCADLLNGAPPSSSDAILDSFSRQVIVRYGLPPQVDGQSLFWSIMQGAESINYTDASSSGLVLLHIYECLEEHFPTEIISRYFTTSDGEEYFDLWIALGFMMSYMAAGIGLQSICGGECLWTRRSDGAWVLRVV